LGLVTDNYQFYLYRIGEGGCEQIITSSKYIEYGSGEQVTTISVTTEYGAVDRHMFCI
jgi:hypothetical protein